MTNNIQYQRADIERDTLLHLYKSMLKPRLIEEKMLVLLRQGKISKWFSGIGQEAIAVGVTSALKKEEFILPMHRNLGVFYNKRNSFVSIVLSIARKDEWFYQRERP